jgi:hypothetical protein
MPFALLRHLYTWIHGDRAAKPWSDFEYFDDKWKRRIKRMSGMIENETSFLDIGCGKMWLKEFLPQGGVYHGCDYTRRDETTIICDFNKKEFPSLSIDCCFASGVIEYLDDPRWLFDQAFRSARSLIFSYCPLEIQPDLPYRKSLGWRNHVSREYFFDTAKSIGYNRQTELLNFDGCDLYKFKNGNFL